MTYGDLMDRLRGKRVLVVGDVMLDEYILGRATRISPEAPVMVIRKEGYRSVPGGAANVAANVLALGGEAVLVGLCGEDAPAQELRDGLEAMGLSTSKVLADPSRPTTRKTRILAEGAHQVLRIDEESTAPASEQVTKRLRREVTAALPEVDALLLSDYQKGALPPDLIRELVVLAREAGLPAIGNAKPRSAASYRGATLVSLNRPESAEALGVEHLEADEASSVAAELVRRFGFRHALATFGREGFAVAGEALSEPLRVPAPSVEVADPAGAGDTTIAAVALGIAGVGVIPEVFWLAAQVAAAVVSHTGVAVPQPEDLEGFRARAVGVSS